MENAQLIGLSRQTALRNQLTVVANNMANINTTGFKSQNLLFEEYLMPIAEATEFQTPDETLSYVLDYKTHTDFQNGSFKYSGNDLDLALEGQGFFVVQLEDGTEAYTRNGAFHLDSTGTLVTSEGRPVLTSAGPMTFTNEDGDIEIAEDGTISTELGVRGQIRTASFEDPQELEKLGDTMYLGEEPQLAAGIRVVQGALEQSNVEGIFEVTQLIEIQRAYESVTKMLKDVNDLRQQAIGTLGKLEA
ncbi:flagellar basal-body rod protein FlgF [Roseibium denhamense]|uniref:Flagellar basal-body rod protein FlgF n=1 Tax=Roseibium denhamense TaxID=76305 RepID=A0ABY1N7Z8_9HYPH|nr:flagellar basal-body rod protein FlgF [Roseibium denhamense]MTI05944.1 flagellar basal-body rod protein FlgF [Roseibium denhamense]SMP02936.1 flagellar basal-body rod protein FlgF [Roseibium denhamense]